MKKLAALLTLLVVCAAVPGGQGKRFITEKDLFKFTWVADPQISPDGATIAFVRVTVNEKENRYETSVFAVPAAGGAAPRRLTSGIRDTTPRWSPDGKRIAFVRSTEKDGKAQPAQIYLLQHGRRRGAGDHRDRHRRGKSRVVSRRHAHRLRQFDERRRREEGGRPETGRRAQERRRGRHARGLSRERQSWLRRQRASRAHLQRRGAGDRDRRISASAGVR